MSESTERVAVVTGGSLGIGEAISTLLLHLGWRVHVLARRASSCAHAAHDGCIVHDVDIRDIDAIKESADTVASSSGHVDALVLCAGVGYPTPLVSVSRAQYDELCDTNVAGAVFSTQAFAPLLRDGEAVITFVSSIAGRRGFADWSLYCASKHALEGFAASIREEFRARRIRVTCIQPGSVDTPSYDHLPPEEKKEFMDARSIAELTVAAIRLPRQACVETLFINNAAGDL
ncbi:SDR family oxidoreductase [Streptomyces sp. B1866]|uniref:SDR family oxidoreductase n=1 Tax=Streptomyces sp. B1866 TaxID=3075431 RepID=UPI0028900D22|nr:SDR family oxidoreductase [Streptomyces sp. B1866]MDT3400088.1 SDR family oxidoreductase [Streptomyces sp. B1866]